MAEYPRTLADITSRAGMMRMLNLIQERIEDADAIGWIALRQAWEQELARAELIMIEKGWDDERRTGNVMPAA